MFITCKGGISRPCLYDFFSSLQQVEYALKVWPPISETPCVYKYIYGSVKSR